MRDGPDGLILGEKHVGITIACLDDDRRILVQHRRHRVFDKVWSLSGDTHPRKYDTRKVETVSEAARRCAKEDLGVVIKRWRKTVCLSYSARDPRDPRYCENELLHILAAKHGGLVHMNKKNAYELRWAKFSEILRDSQKDLKRSQMIANTHLGSTPCSHSRLKRSKKPCWATRSVIRLILITILISIRRFVDLETP